MTTYQNGDVIKDKYTILRKEADGCSSEIYVVYEVLGHRKIKEYALKVISKEHLTDDFLDQLETEVRIHRNLNHPNIVSFHDHFYDNDNFCIMTDYMHGGDLLLMGKRIKDKQIRRYFRQIAEALKYCHDRGVLHRDLKLENILTDGYSKVKLADFGSSTMKDESDEYLGTIVYFSPERLLRELYDYRADLWSLGIVFYELLYFSHPFTKKGKIKHDELMELIDEKLPLQFPVNPKRQQTTKSVINDLLQIDKDNRIELEEILKMF